MEGDRLRGLVQSGQSERRRAVQEPALQGAERAPSFGKPYYYFVYSAAVTEVEIDVLTGEFTILRTDILYDAGKSPNPAIDVGQLEGGYVQGVGFVHHRGNGLRRKGRPWSPTTSGATSRRAPRPSRSISGCGSIRSTKHATTWRRRAELQAVKSSKTTGEPSMTLGITAYFAIKRAIMDARRELTGNEDWLTIDLPATCQRIQMNCGVSTESLTLCAESDNGQGITATDT